MRKRYSCYEYETFYEKLPHAEGWAYKIYTDNDFYREIWGTDEYRDSEEFYENESQAEIAAIAHIDLIENGEG